MSQEKRDKYFFLHPSNENKNEDKTHSHTLERTPPLRNFIKSQRVEKSLQKWSQEERLALMLIIKPLMPHEVMKFIRRKEGGCKRSWDQILGYSTKTSFYFCKLCVQMVRSTNSLVFFWATRGRWGKEESSTMDPTAFSDCTSPVLTLWRRTTLRYLVAPCQVENLLICNKYIRKPPCTSINNVTIYNSPFSSSLPFKKKNNSRKTKKNNKKKRYKSGSKCDPLQCVFI